MLLSQQTYQLAIFACCTEVVLHAYVIHSLKFPRVLQIYGLSAFHFYKVIELVVQAVVEKLSRDVVKHLNAVSFSELSYFVLDQTPSDFVSAFKYVSTKIPASLLSTFFNLYLLLGSCSLQSKWHSCELTMAILNTYCHLVSIFILIPAALPNQVSLSS